MPLDINFGAFRVRKRRPSCLLNLGLFLLTVFAGWWFWPQPEMGKERTGKAARAMTGVSAYPKFFLAHACAAAENASLVGRDLIAPKKVEASPKPRAVVRLPFYEKYVPVPKGQNPNSVRLQRSQVPRPYGGAKIVNGKFVCDKEKNKPRRSKKNDKNHIDMQCCLDPDEIPNPYCSY